MRIPFGWLQDFVKLDIPPEDLCEPLIMLGFSDAYVIPNEWDCLEGFVVGKALSVSAHPSDHRLKVVEVNLGFAKAISVCGAPNVFEGGLFAVALPGAKLASGHTVASTEIGGVKSEVVLCSGFEAWLDDSKDELLELGKELMPGTPLLEALGLDEPVIEVEVTPNRSDCLGLFGIAREVAALFGKELIKPEPAPKENGRPVEELVSVEIKDTKGCARYGAMVLEEVKVGKSMAFLRARLRLAGIRPINNVVDATNMVMFETGHPLHPFDLDKISGSKILVRRARAGEKLIGIDHKEYQLSQEDLTIADEDKPIAIAGIIGGKNTEVDGNTSTVLLEGAFFDNASIWRTAKRLGITSEASYRFARGVDIGAIPYVVTLASEIIQEMTGCRACVGRIDIYPEPRKTVYVEASPKRINKLLGVSIPDQEICELLEQLGFLILPGKELLVGVPTRRADVQCEADIAEEVARLYGYDKIPASREKCCASQGKVSRIWEILWSIRNALTGMGLTEVVTDPMVSPDLVDQFGVNRDEMVGIINPVGIHTSALRTLLAPALIRTLTENQNKGRLGVAIFEIGKIYRRGNDGFYEAYMLGLGLAGIRNPRVWWSVETDYDFFDMKGIVEALLHSMRCDYEIKPGGPGFLHPGRKAIIVNKVGQAESEIGYIGELSPALSKKYDARGRLYLAEILVDALIFEEEFRKALEPIKYPGVKRDIAVVVSKNVHDADIRRIILDEAGNIVESIDTFDLYEGNQIPEGTKSLGYAIVFRSYERTLEEKEVAEIEARIEARIKADLGGFLRRKED
ncbi:MAG: phenylalanine--tRNA ligase subunit beta [bacterium]